MSDKETQNQTPDATENPSHDVLKGLTDELHGTFEKFKELNDAAEAERKMYGTELGESKERLEKVEKHLNQIETKIERIAKLPDAEGSESVAVDEAEIYSKAFWNFGRKGMNGISAEEKATMIVGDDTTGGYLAPPEFVQEIIKGVLELNPMRGLARVRSTSSRLVMQPSRTSVGQVFWTGAETASYQETGPRYGMEKIPVHEASAVTPVSNQDLEDSAFDLEGELRNDMVEQFAVAEGTSFISGDGVSQPEGFLTHPDIVEVNSGAAALPTADGLIDMYYSLPEVYASTATWIMKRATVAIVRKLKDTGTGSDMYVWQPGIAGTAPSTILGAPYVEAPGMPTVAANAFPIALGAWNKGYLIVDRLAIGLLRDEFTQAKKGVVEFIARKRVGGQVVLAEAILKQKMSV